MGCVVEAEAVAFADSCMGCVVETGSVAFASSCVGCIVEATSMAFASSCASCVVEADSVAFAGFCVGCLVEATAEAFAGSCTRRIAGPAFVFATPLLLFASPRPFPRGEARCAIVPRIAQISNCRRGSVQRRAKHSLLG